jgi:hypothetical protein
MGKVERACECYVPLQTESPVTDFSDALAINYKFTDNLIRTVIFES